MFEQKSKVMRIGSRVKHNFSGELGTVIAWRKDKHGYDYKVKWDNVSPDWYQLKVLELL